MSDMLHSSQRKEHTMYRIQAFNTKTQRFTVYMVKTMEERTQTINDLIATGNYSPAGISFEWLARM